MAKFLEAFAKSVADHLDFYTERNDPYYTDGGHIRTNVFGQRVQEVTALIAKPAFKPSDLPAYLDAIRNQSNVGLDDRQLLLEKVLVLMSRLPPDISRKIQEYVIALLYNDLPHPPSSYIGPYDFRAPVTAPPLVKYAFRSADGSNYNPLFPSLGKAGMPYARSVPAIKTVPKHVLPDSGLVFDTLLCREEFTEHPGGISSLFFAFADLVIHSIFDTDPHDWSINRASSYLDLSILYGSSESQVNQVRRKDGTGKLWDDVFADGRLLHMPPATCALLVLMNRNHNYIAEKLLNINENGNFAWPPKNDEQRRLQDDEIFHRTRLVNCGFFMNIILGDYVGAILALPLDGRDWRLDPLMNMRQPDHAVSPRGEGNVVSIEFNLLYRWHATLSEEDAAWTTAMFKEAFPGKDLSKITIKDFKDAAHKLLIPDADVKKWTFGGLERQPNGRFKDDDLARIIQDATGRSSAAFSSGVPGALRIVEILAIEQSRSWGTCSLNEFRKFLGLKPYKSFKEWNPDTRIHTAAAALYKDIDNLELHVGLQAEQCKEPGPGAGLCPGYTISRAILADAVALTRGDRYLTTEFTPYNCTAWGYNDCQYDHKDGSYGGLLTKLLFRTLPDHYPAGSTYAHFPFLVPDFLKDELMTRRPEVVDQYDWDPPSRPSPTVGIKSYDGVKQVLTDHSFLSAYNERLLTVSGKAMQAKVASDRDAALVALTHGRAIVEKLLPSTHGKHSPGTWAEYFKQETLSLIKDKSVCYRARNSKTLDIVQDVINLLPIHWISEEIIGLPLKTATNKDGTWYEQDVYKKFADVGRYVFLNFDPADDWHLHVDSVGTFSEVYEFIMHHLKNDHYYKDSAVESAHGQHFLRRVFKAFKDQDVPNEELSAYVFAAVVPTVAHFSQAIAHVVDFYLDKDKQRERAHIVELATSVGQNPDSVNKIMTYVREALRINAPVSGVYRTAGRDVSVPGYPTIQARERVFLSLVDASRDPAVFGDNPTSAAYDRTQRGLLGLGEHGLLSSAFFETTVPAILGTILGLKNIRRAANNSGKLAQFIETWHGSPRQLYIDTKGKVTPFPDSLFVEFD
ncbi:putative animal haem peroxidase [Lyophyllum shimeji]|uniref:Animal haem peroxidase n=1 Tax=Lyophyllum shimeji TaxID=47721 RepID=A0A9P3PS83_LYOSH|nr:putative animal haem peroxidase [Lyophyllum shimeji]